MEGLHAGAIPIVLNTWEGSEYIYPPSIIFKSIDEIVDYIVKLSQDDKLYFNTLIDLQAQVSSMYNGEKFMSELNILINKLALNL
jgi:hypothetical protein